MIQERQEHLKDLINTMIVLDNCDRNELLKKSQELDELIVQSMKENYQEKIEYEIKGKLKANTVFNNMNLFSKKYDSMRLVDPVAKDGKR